MRVQGIGPSTFLTNSGPPTLEPGNTLTISQPSSSACGNFRRRAAAGAVGNLAAVADLGHVGVEDRADHELGAIGDEQAGGRRIDDRAHAHDDARIGLGEMAGDFQEGLGREVAAVGELDALGAAIGAGLDHLEADLGIGMEKDRDHALARSSPAAPPYDRDSSSFLPRAVLTIRFGPFLRRPYSRPGGLGKLAPREGDSCPGRCPGEPRPKQPGWHPAPPLSAGPGSAGPGRLPLALWPGERHGPNA